MRTGADAIQQREEIGFFDDAGAVLADLDLDEHRHGNALLRKDGLRCRHLTGRVHAERELHAPLRQRRDAAELRLADDLICNKNVVQSGRRHCFGFADFRHGDTAGPGGELHLRNLRALVRLRVRAEGHAVRVRVGLHVLQVFRQPLPVDEQRRGVEFYVSHRKNLLWSLFPSIRSI